jgi:protein-disulfide isomerase
VDTGKVKMVFRDFPLDNIHPAARPAAEAAQCAQPQGKYWQYHDALFDRQEQLPSLDYVKLAGELGLDTAAFQKCLTEGAYAAEVQQDMEAGIALGITGTPGTFVNGILIEGAYPYETYKATIEDALREAR